MSTHRDVKNLLYGQVARVGRALASAKRLEILDLLCQAEKTVDGLARDAALNVKTASAHLKELKAARLVVARKHGKYVHYSLADQTVCDSWIALRSLAEARLLEMQGLLREFVTEPENLTGLDRRSILAQARRGDITVIDVRPGEEYLAGHLPYARSLPLSELQKKLKSLPKGRQIVAYCRGPYCMFAKEAVALLRKQGYRATRLEDGVPEWRRAGFPVEAAVAGG